MKEHRLTMETMYQVLKEATSGDTIIVESNVLLYMAQRMAKTLFLGKIFKFRVSR